MDPSKMMPKMNATGAVRAGVMWHGSPNHQTHGAVSVVTTVYPGVPPVGTSAQTYNTPTTHMINGPSMFPTSGHHPPPSPYIDQQGSISKPMSNPYDPDPNHYGMQHMQQHQQQQQHPRYQSTHGPMADYGQNAPRHAMAVNAAARAAAAAVATATATATAVAIDQSQYQNYPQEMQYGNQAYHSPPASMPQQVQHHSMVPQMMPQQRPMMPSPYVPGGLRATRPPMPGAPRYPTGSMVRPADAYYQHQQQYNSGVPAQAMMPSSGPPRQILHQQQQQHMVPSHSPQAGRMPNSYHPQQQQQQISDPRGQYYPPPMPSSASTGPPPYSQTMAPTSMQSNYGQHGEASMPNYQHVQGNSGVYPGSTLPNNPTPPLTPATPATNGPGGYGMNNASGSSQNDVEESRLTLPLKNGVVLAPFRLEHNSPVSQHMFVLEPKTYQMLMSSTNMDLQLKCFHAEDKSMSNNWPNNANIQICVNGSPVPVKSIDRPLYVKSLCQKQQNTLQVAVRQCCCSHLFCLTVVNRPTVESVVREITRLRSIPTEQCIEKIKHFFDSGEVAKMRKTSSSECNPDIEQMSVSMSLKCPITMKRIKLPARAKECKHQQCFDLYSYFEINKDRSNWHCPICRSPAGIESLEIDQYVLVILAKLNSTDVEEVTLDCNAVWKPVVRPPNDNRTTGTTAKEEETGTCGGPKRFKPDPDSAFPGPPSAGPHFQSPVYSRPDGAVLSPFYQTNNSPVNGPSSFGPGSAGTPMGVMPNFGSPPRPIQSPRKPSRSGGQTAVPSRQPSIDDAGTDHFTQHALKQEVSGAYGNSNEMNQIQSPAAGGGSSFVASSMPAGAAGTNANVDNGAASVLSSDFPDFTFDDSDLLGSGSSTQTGPTLFNDPEELLKYLVDPGDYSGFGVPGGEQQQTQGHVPDGDAIRAGSFANYLVKNGPGHNASSDGNYDHSSTTAASSDATSMDDILSLFNK